MICSHHFQVFVDKNFQIRGYQKVDLELNKENSIKLRNGVKTINQKEKEKYNLFEKITLDGNNIKYYPLNSIEIGENIDLKEDIKHNNKKMTLKEIYEEFWEFIDEDNIKFQKFIINDTRRKEYIKKYETIKSEDHLIYQSI